jgi:hypothetical protein
VSKKSAMIISCILLFDFTLEITITFSIKKLRIIRNKITGSGNFVYPLIFI